MKPSIIVTVIFLFIISIAHLLRLLFHVKVTANSAEMPMWPSAVACIAVTALALWLWKENRK